MIGREYSHVFPAKPKRSEAPAPVLQIDNLSWGERLQNISLSVGKGEIVGIGGLDGQGQRELLLALFGVLRGVSGTIRIDGQPVKIPSPRAAKSERLGLALIPEDRKTEGLLLPMSVRANISMASIAKLSNKFAVDSARENRKIDEMIAKLSIKAGDVDAPVATLSGGNQQKVVIAKWLMTDARIVLLNDPTRGIDVGTKQEMYQLLRQLADSGTAILFYTTDYDELVGCCDRVAILYDGRLLRELRDDAITEHNIVASALNLPLEARVPEERAG
jgi:ribose transport system ATP-binding protein